MSSSKGQPAADSGHPWRLRGNLHAAPDVPAIGEICQMISENSAGKEV